MQQDIVYYTTSRGQVPVRLFINSLELKQRAKVRRTFLLITEYGFFALPNKKKLTGTPFWEIRILGKDNIRIFCVISQNKVLMLHGFIKKSQKTPQKEISIAMNRYQEWRRNSA